MDDPQGRGSWEVHEELHCPDRAADAMELLADELAASRLLRNAADYPACNVDMSNWSSDDVQACKADTGGFLYRPYTAQAMIQLCKSAACMRVADFMKADNPTECMHVIGPSTTLVLYQNLLDPLDATCLQLSASKVTDPLPTTPPQSTITPSTPAKTTRPQTPTATPSTKTPSSTKSSSSGGNGDDDGSSTEGDSSGVDSSSSGSRSPTSGTRAPSPSTILSPSSSSSSASSSLSTSSPTPASSQNDLPFEITPATAAPATTTSSSKSSPTGLVVGLSIGAVIICVVVLTMIVWKRRRKGSKTYQAYTPAKFDDETTNTTHDTNVSKAHEQYAPLLRQLDDWRIDSCELVDVKMIGSGAQGSVHLVALDGSRQLASKRLITDQVTERRLSAFVVEIQLVASLQHPSIVSFVGVAWTTAADLQALFEFMSNGDLRTHLDHTKPLEPEPWTHQKLTMALQIAEGLVYMHSFSPPIVHRDLRARNILLDSVFNAKISDFGVSRSQSEQGTMTTGIGTSRWLAPEVIMGGGGYTEQCDIYAFGVVLTEIDTHELPFAEERLAEIELLHRVATGTIRAKISTECDPPIRELIEQCLAIDPSERPNALELTYRLRKTIKAQSFDQQNSSSFHTSP